MQGPTAGPPSLLTYDDSQLPEGSMDIHAYAPQAAESDLLEAYRIFRDDSIILECLGICMEETQYWRVRTLFTRFKLDTGPSVAGRPRQVLLAT